MSDPKPARDAKAELAAMQTIVLALQGLDDCAIRRVLRWALEALTIPQAIQPKARELVP